MNRSELKFTVQGEKRKQMAQIISELTGKPAVYKKTPTYAYEIGGFTISKDGELSWGEDVDQDTLSGVIVGLQMMGFTAIEPVRTIRLVQTANENEEVDAEDAPDMPDVPDTPGETDSNKLTVEIPLRLMNEAAFANLNRLIEGKGKLIRKSIGADNLAYKVDGNKVLFPWFT